MLRLLNRVKRNLLKEGKIKTFLFYTIGEVFLVVIGILIAIQLDRLNEVRKDNDKRDAYTASILSDLRKDSVMIKNHLKVIEYELQKIDNLTEKLSQFNTPSRALIDTAYLNFRSTVSSIQVFNNNTFEILTTTGDIGLFDRNNQELLLESYKAKEVLLQNNNGNKEAFLTTALKYWELFLVGRDKFEVPIPNEVLQKLWLQKDPEEVIPIIHTTIIQKEFAIQTERVQLVRIDSMNNQLINALVGGE